MCDIEFCLRNQRGAFSFGSLGGVNKTVQYKRVNLIQKVKIKIVAKEHKISQAILGEQSLIT